MATTENKFLIEYTQETPMGMSSSRTYTTKVYASSGTNDLKRFRSNNK